MKKEILSFVLLICLFTTGCNTGTSFKNESNETSIESNVENTQELNNQDSLIDLSVYLNDVKRVSGYYGMISSYIFNSENQNLIHFLSNQACNIKFTEVLTEENKDETNFGCDRSFTFYIEDGIISLIITNQDNMYVTYYQTVEDENLESGHSLKTVWKYKAIKPEERKYFMLFTGLGFPLNHYWCETPVCTKYIDELDKYDQDIILYSFIDNYSPVQEFLTDGTLFSGYISKYLGLYQKQYHAIIIDGCGFQYIECEEIVEIDGVEFNYHNGNRIHLVDSHRNFIDLKTAFDEGKINHDDLDQIAKRLKG